jgi:penicillin amidase
MNVARNWSDFTGALRDLVVPAQNFVYGDVDGHIGYYAPGRIPLRPRGDGSRPVDGAGDDEWTGWVHFESLPHVIDPPEHFIVTANNRPVAGKEYPFVLGTDWPEPYRAARVTEMITGGARVTADDFARIQSDTVSMQARALLPALLRHARPSSAAERQAVDILRAWDGNATATSGAAPIFEAWFLGLAPSIAGDELPPSTLAGYAGRFSFVTRFLTSVLGADNS